jgi:hypothetical protein
MALTNANVNAVILAPTVQLAPPRDCLFMETRERLTLRYGTSAIRVETKIDRVFDVSVQQTACLRGMICHETVFSLALPSS